MLLPLALAGCLENEDTRNVAFVEEANAVQPMPTDYRSQTIAFLHTYLNNPVGVRNATVADPVQRTVGGRPRYVACLRFSEIQSDGSYRDPRTRAVLFVDGRLDRIIPNPGDECAGVVYGPFPELEKMTR